MAGELKAAIQARVKEAMKAKDAERLAVLRMLLNEINSAELYHGSTDELAAVRGYHKKLTKARAEYEKLNQPERIAELDREIAVVEQFLPAAMTDAELESVVEQAIAAGGYAQRDFGRAMKEILAAHGDRVEGARLSAILKAKLAGHG